MTRTQRFIHLCSIFLSFVGTHPLLHAETKPSPDFFHHVLDNGLNVIIKTLPHAANVAVQMWYNVGSKDEQVSEKGLAHLLEHMVFKGTSMLCETDIQALAAKLSGDSNAYTSYDTTTYTFTIPSRHWQEVLPVFASTMHACTFKDDLLNSEFKTVIQEFKLSRENYSNVLFLYQMNALFPDHPYHYPIVGFKKDIWNTTGADLKAFYRTHYHPTNATLVIVGNVHPLEALNLIKHYFNALKPEPFYTKKSFSHTPDIRHSSVTLYREIAQPQLKLSFIVPGLREKQSVSLNALVNTLGNGTSSRLYIRLHEQEKLVHDVSCHLYPLFEYSVLEIDIEPTKTTPSSFERIKKIVNTELADIAQEGLTLQEYTKATQAAWFTLYSTQEKPEDIAHLIGTHFCAHGDPLYGFTLIPHNQAWLNNDITELIKTYMRPSLMCCAHLLPLPISETEPWKKHLAAIEQEDNDILAKRMRTSPIEKPHYARTINGKPTPPLSLPVATEYALENGLTLLTYHQPTVPLITIRIALHADMDYDDAQLPGIYTFLSHLLMRGTKNVDAIAFSERLAQLGTTLSITPGFITLQLFKEHAHESLLLLKDILLQPRFDRHDIEAVRKELIATRQETLLDAAYRAKRAAIEALYTHHPYSNDRLGTLRSLKAIKRTDLITFFNTVITPHNALIAVVGDIKEIDAHHLIASTLGEWHGKELTSVTYPILKPVIPTTFIIPMDRDQVQLIYAAPSIALTHKDYESYALFDEIFGKGANSRLFALREQTGLFYTIQGTLLYHSDRQPGIMIVNTVVSPTNLMRVTELLAHTFDTVIDTLTPEDIEAAKETLLSDARTLFDTQESIASMLLFLRKNNLPLDYYHTQAARLQKITVENVKNAVRTTLRNDHRISVVVGI